MRIGDIETEQHRGYRSVPIAIDLEVAVGEVVDRFIAFTFGNLNSVGTPEMVADDIEHWIDDCGVDGTNMLQRLPFETANGFVDLIEPASGSAHERRPLKTKSTP